MAFQPLGLGPAGLLRAAAAPSDRAPARCQPTVPPPSPLDELPACSSTASLSWAPAARARARVRRAFDAPVVYAPIGRSLWPRALASRRFGSAIKRASSSCRAPAHLAVVTATAKNVKDEGKDDGANARAFLEEVGLSDDEIGSLSESVLCAPVDVLAVLYEHIEPYDVVQLPGLSLMTFRDFLLQQREQSERRVQLLALLYGAGVDARGLDALLSTDPALSDPTDAALSPERVGALVEALRGPFGLAPAEVRRLLVARPAILHAHDLPGLAAALEEGGMEAALRRAAALRLPSTLLVEPAHARAALAFLAEEAFPGVEGAAPKFAARWPAVLGLSVERVLRPKLRWLALNGFTAADLWRAPAYLAASVSGRVAPRCTFIRSLLAARAAEAPPGVTFEQPEPTLEELVALSDAALAARYSFPQAALARFRRQSEKLLGARRVRRFLTELGLTAEEAEAALRRRPSLALAHVGQELAPVRALLEGAGLSREEVAEVARRYVQALQCARLEAGVPQPQGEALHFLRSTLRLEGEALRRVVRRFPQALTLARETLEGRLEFFLDAGFPPADLGAMVARLPNLLGPPRSIPPRPRRRPPAGFAPATLAPKAAAFAADPAFGGDRGALLAFPHFFSLSLEERIAPRLAFMHARGRAGAVALKRVLDCSDERFAATIARAPLEEYHRFRDELRAQRQAAAEGSQGGEVPRPD